MSRRSSWPRKSKPLAEDRHSRAQEAELVLDPDGKASREVSNGLRQYEAVAQAIEYYLDPDRPFKLRPSLILQFQRIALEGLSSYAGNFRPAPIEIGGSSHKPPNAYQVPELIEELCDYVNEHWDSASALHLAAYVVWRLNWIHPFTDGNGRTSRAVSYLILCLKLGFRLPGTNTIPEQIADNKKPYYDALEAADQITANVSPDLTAMENLLQKLLANQLASVLKKAQGS